MRQSQLFSKTRKEFPKDEVAVNAKLLTRANFINKLMSGVFTMLPLGFRVREKIINIIREEMNAIGGAELLMPALHHRSVWDVTGRWEDLKEIMYQFKDKAGKELGLGSTHEEIIAEVAKGIINSYTDLPLYVYQIQTKFRDEPRAKSGLLRGREFTMKDLYSFHTDEISLNNFYEEAKKAYIKIFNRCGLKVYVTEASGGVFSKEYSHEFMVESSAGEDEIFLCRLCGFARNKEIADKNLKKSCPKCASGVLDKVKSIEAGNIFKLGTRFSEPTKLFYKDKEGKNKPVVMGSYGIGVERMMGTIVEIYHDDKGIIWPEAMAPYKIHLLLIGEAERELTDFADNVYRNLIKSGLEVLYDDRYGIAAGEKFFDADLIGLPYRAVVSAKTMAQGKVEIKKRNEKEVKLVKVEELLKMFNYSN